MQRKAYHHGNLREALLDEGLKILDAEGPDALGVRRLARELGVTHSAPANHFPRRSHLYSALAVRCFESLEAAIAERAHQSAVDSIRSMASATLDFGLAWPHRYRLMFRRDLLDAQHADLQQAMNRLYGTLLETIRSLLPEQKTVSAESYAISLWSMVHGYLVMRLDGNLVAATDDVSGQDRQAAILELWLAGLPCNGEC